MRSRILLFLASCLMIFGNVTSQAEQSASRKVYEQGDIVELIAMNKLDAKSKRITANVGEITYYKNIEILPHKCFFNNNDEDLSYAMVSVTENKMDDEDKIIFFGWLFSESISLSVMEHPVYELFLVNCRPQAVSYEQIKKADQPAPLLSE